MTERAKYPKITADRYRQLAESALQSAEILVADHGPDCPAAVTERQFAAYYRRRALQAGVGERGQAARS